MDMRQAAQTIRDTVEMDTVLGLYGYRARRGVMPCPFHGERNPSLKIYPGTGGWHCFGCGKGGSVIDFVQEQEGCDFRTAVRAIDKALGLGLFDPKEDAEQARQEKRRQEWLDGFVKAAGAWCDSVIRAIETGQRTRLSMVRILEERAKEDPQALEAGDWDEMLKWKEDDEYDEYRKAKVEAFREEVAAWRRKRRRAKSAS